MLGKDYGRQDCALAGALEVLGERWTLLILRDAFLGVRRYSDFVTRLDIPRAVLSDRLRGLVDNGVMLKRHDATRSGRHDNYELTDAGKTLWPALHALISWGSEHRRPSSNVYRHVPCGQELQTGALCPKCGITAPADEVLVEPRLRRSAGHRDDPVNAMMRRPRRLLEPVVLDPSPAEHATTIGA